MKKVNLLYDATVVCNILLRDSSRSGIFFVAYNVLLEFLKRPEYEVYLYAEDLIKLKEVIDTYPEFSNCKIYKFSRVQDWVSFFRNLKNQNKQQNGLSLLRGVYALTASILKKFYMVLEARARLSEIDVYFTPMSAVPNFISKKKHIKCFTILHDAIPMIDDDSINPRIHKWYEKLVRSINDQSFYFANSRYTKQDFLKYVPEMAEKNISVVPLSTGKPYSNIADFNEINNVKQRYNIPLNKKYIFSLCSLNKRKNLIFAIRNFLEFTNRNQLNDFVFVLGGAFFDDFIPVLKKNLQDFGNVEGRILHIGYVEDEDLSALYSGAEMFLYPSLYEGFGMPVLEAMKCGVPVICSNCTSIPEVIGDCGIQIDPHNDEEMVCAMEKMYFDRDFRAACIAKGMERAKLFSWDKCGEVIDNKIRSVINGI